MPFCTTGQGWASLKTMQSICSKSTSVLEPLKILRLTPKLRNLKIIIFKSKGCHRDDEIPANPQAQMGGLVPKQVLFPLPCPWPPPLPSAPLNSEQLLKSGWQCPESHGGGGFPTLTCFRNKFQKWITSLNLAKQNFFHLFRARNFFNSLGKPVDSFSEYFLRHKIKYIWFQRKPVLLKYKYWSIIQWFLYYFSWAASTKGCREGRELGRIQNTTLV